jgi:hypothetical protein
MARCRENPAKHVKIASILAVFTRYGLCFSPRIGILNWVCSGSAQVIRRAVRFAGPTLFRAQYSALDMVHVTTP